MSKQADIILSVQGITNRFGKQTVHQNLKLDVIRGEILGLVGGSGSGKSVLLKTMVGLHAPNKGKVTLADKPIDQLTPAESASLFAVMFQNGALFSSLTVSENIKLPIKEYTNLPEEVQDQLVQLKLALVGLKPEEALKYPSQISGGMVKRAALARALAMDPEILFLDEPTAGLDPLLADQFDALIKNLSKSLGITIVLVTHDLDTLFSVCDRVAVLVDHNVTVGTLPELLKNDHQWIQEFFHGPRGHGAAVAAKEAYGNE